MKVSASILSADFACLGDEIKRIHEFIDWIHIDVMDGHFVPNITFGPKIVKSIRKYTDKVFDVHLMISEPEKYIDVFADSGADYITVHLESGNTIELIKKIRDLNKKPGISIKPSTPIEDLFGFIDKIELILIMSVEPGFGGQEFMSDVLEKIQELRKEIDKRNSTCKISVDGGINNHTAKLVKDAGADIVVSGSSIFKSLDYKEAIKAIRG